jgi:acyl-CoA reductase-like NAD-dependent aldehyde dehydrogenase
LEFLKGIINIVNLESFDEMWDLVSIDGWNYVVFGSWQTTEDVAKNIGLRAKPRKIVQYGAGFSATIIDESVGDDIETRKDVALQVLESVSVNRGNECLSTDVIYIHSEIYHEFIRLLQDLKDDFQSFDPLQRKSIGTISQRNYDFIKQTLHANGKLRFAKVGTVRFHRPEDGHPVLPTIHTSLIPLFDIEAATVYPGPIASVKKYSSSAELKQHMNFDLGRNKDDRFLSCSVFGSGKFFQEIVEGIPAYTVKHNIPSHMIDLNRPHQGIFLVEELTDRVNVETRA